MPFKFDDSGFKKLQKDLNKHASNADKIDGKYKLEDIFNPTFMRKYTKFNSIESFFEASPFVIESEKDFDNIDEQDLDKYIQQQSSFNSWNEFKGKAGELFIAQKLGF